MSIQLLQWGLFSFMLGLMLSIPLGAVYYLQSPALRQIITNPRKLKSAHLDFLMQAFAIGFVYLLEFALKWEFPIYVVAPLIFGTICNPLIFLLEATPLHRAGFFEVIYKLLKVISPLALLFAWCVIALHFLPEFLQLLLLAMVLLSLFLIIKHKSKFNTRTETQY